MGGRYGAGFGSGYTGTRYENNPFLKASERERTARKAERAIDVLENYREQATGKSAYLDRQREETAREAGAALEKEPMNPILDAILSPFRAISPTNLKEISIRNDPLRNVPAGPTYSGDDALAYIGRIYEPGSPEYRSFETQVANIRSRASLQKSAQHIARMDPKVTERDILDMDVEGLEQYLSAGQAIPKPRISDERTEKGGEPYEQVTARDPFTGEMLSGFPTEGGPAFSPYGATGREPHLLAEEKESGRQRAKRVNEGRKQRGVLVSLSRSAAAASSIVGDGRDPQGRFRGLAGLTQSFVSQMGQGLRFMKMPLDKLLSSDPFPTLMATSVDDARMRQLEMSMAAAVASFLEPGEANINRNQFKAGLAIVSPIFRQGAGRNINAQLRQLMTQVINSFSDTNRDILGDTGRDVPPFTVGDAPWLGSLMGLQRSPGITLTKDERARLSEGGVRVLGTWDELQKQGAE